MVSTEELTLQKPGRSVRWSLRTLSGTRGHRAGDTSPLPRRHRESSPGQIPKPRGSAKPGHTSLPGERGAGEEALPESPPSGLQPWPPGGPAFLESTAILDGRCRIVLTIECNTCRLVTAPPSVDNDRCSRLIRRRPEALFSQQRLP